MKSIATRILLSSGIAVGISQRQTSPGCCFQLVSAGELNAIVDEDGSGALLVGGNSQDGDFCLDPTSRAITDELGKSCFIQDANYQFGCFNSTTGPLTPFDMTTPDAYGRSYLSYGDRTQVFHACPAGSANDQGYYIYADSKPDKTGCFEINLQLGNQSTECHTQNPSAVGTASPSTPPPITIITTLAVRTDGGSPVTQIGIASAAATASASETSAPSRTCKVSPSAPSLPPVKVGHPDAGAQDGIRDSSAEVSISPDNSTVFRYSIPASFPASANTSGGGGGIPTPRLCALQFRMPVCSELPEGYPCYHFSGLEQEMVSNSGMNFALVEGANGDDEGEGGGATANWDNAALHQVMPGEDSVVGTFECGAPPPPPNSTDAGGRGREIAWKATGVRNFSLEFLQAGVGDRPRFRDGIGAWIVPCL